MESDERRDEGITPSDATPTDTPSDAPEPPEPDEDHVVEEKGQPE